MKNIAFFQTLLGQTDPWIVGSVELDTAGSTVTIEMIVKAGTIWGCPECRRRMHVHGWTRRRWRHLDTQQFHTWISAEVPTVRCEEHGDQQVQVPWSEPYSRFSLRFEQFAIALLQGMSTSAAAKVLHISWDEADGIKRRAVRRGQLRQPQEIRKFLCVDEKHIGRGGYITIVSCVDSGRGRVVYVAPGRDQDALDGYWKQLTPEQLAGIESVSIDMSSSYTNSILKHVPDAERKLVYDRYHVSQQMNKAVDEVRRHEQSLMAAPRAKQMKGHRYWWLYSPDHLPQQIRQRFKKLMKMARKTAKAWEFKELLRAFWECPDEETGREHLKQWLKRALRSSLKPVKRVAKMCKTHLANLLTFFEHRHTNASAEAINSRIQTLINQACGYRNVDRLTTDIFFHFGDLDLEPYPGQ